MIIEIKFKPNDHCYPIFLVETEYCACCSPICIDHIIIFESNIVYVSKWNEQFNEKDCFATEEEAQAECNRRNNETKI